MASGERATVDAATRRRQAVGITIVGALLVGGFFYGLLAKPIGGGSPAVIDAGGGPPGSASAASRPHAITTLAPVGIAGQDPGGGGGGAGEPEPQPVPGVLGPVPPQSPPAYLPLGPVLYLSGTSLIEPNRSAVYAGEVSVTSSGSGFQADGSLTGCARPGAADYYAIPLRNPVSYSGAPRIHARFEGSGQVTVTLFEQHPDGRCTAVATGSAAPVNGALDLTLSPAGHTFAIGMLPGVLVSGSGTLRTDADDPSYGVLPGLTGV